MNDLIQNFEEWKAKLATLGVEIGYNMNPGATNTLLDAIERAIEFELPPELRDFYLQHNGQVEPFNIGTPEHGETNAALFGCFVFQPVQKSLVEYCAWREIFETAGDRFDSDFNQTTVREGDAVSKRYWQPGWFPFATDGGGNSVAVDLTPPSAGTIGQIIVIGPDEDLRRVLASSLSELFKLLAQDFDRERVLAKCAYGGEDDCVIFYSIEYDR
jgi:cell wall assembly regulator SMI1